MIESLKFIYRAYKYRYQLDPQEIKYLINNTKKDDIVVDIGCHKGGYLYWMQKRVGKNGKVYAFEPQEKLFNYLNKTSQLLNNENIIIENMGVSSQVGESNFYVPKTGKGDSPGARIDFLNDEIYNEHRIKTTTLDHYFFNAQIFPDLIKIDVEGHEKQVLLGGLNLLKTHKPKILMECENRHLKDGNVFDVFEVLLNLGYKGYFFINNQFKPITEFKASNYQKSTEGEFWKAKDYVNNFIFES